MFGERRFALSHRWRLGLAGLFTGTTLMVVLGSFGLRVNAMEPGPGNVCGPNPVLSVRFSGLPYQAQVSVDGQPVESRVRFIGGVVEAHLSGLSNGPHQVEVVLTSAARVERKSWTVEVDTVPPELHLLSPASDAAVADSQTTLRGRTEPGATVVLEERKMPADHQGSYAFPVELKPGWNRFQLQAVDPAGNVQTLSTRVFSDSRSPGLRQVSPSDGGMVKTSDLTVKAVGLDDSGLAACNVSVDGGPYRPLPLGGTVERGNELLTPLQLPLKRLAEGRRRLSFQLIDRAGRRDVQELQFVVNTTEKLGGKTLTEGAVGEDVRELQRRLVAAHFLDKDSVTGVFDENTLGAVQALQSTEGMEPDGVVGGATLMALGPRITINLARFSLVLERPGQAPQRYSVAHGMPAYPTPTGHFAVTSLERDPTWIPPDSPWATEAKVTPPGPGNPLGTRWIGLGSTVGIHGTNADWSIGSQSSHGCVRMHIPDVEALFEQVELGTPVTILSGYEDDPALKKYWP